MDDVTSGRLGANPHFYFLSVVVRLYHHYFLNRFVCVGEFFDG